MCALSACKKNSLLQIAQRCSFWGVQITHLMETMMCLSAISMDIGAALTNVWTIHRHVKVMIGTQSTISAIWHWTMTSILPHLYLTTTLIMERIALVSSFHIPNFDFILIIAIAIATCNISRYNPEFLSFQSVSWTPLHYLTFRH